MLSCFILLQLSIQIITIWDSSRESPWRQTMWWLIWTETQSQCQRHCIINNGSFRAFHWNQWRSPWIRDRDSLEWNQNMQIMWWSKMEISGYRLITESMAIIIRTWSLRMSIFMTLKLTVSKCRTLKIWKCPMSKLVLRRLSLIWKVFDHIFSLSVPGMFWEQHWDWMLGFHCVHRNMIRISIKWQF